MRHLVIFSVFLVMLTLSACGEDDRLDQALAFAAQRVQQLGQAITQGELRNAKLIQQYADAVTGSKPALKGIVDTLRKEATVEGQQFKRLQRRVDEVKQLRASYGDPKLLLDELRSISETADPAIFDPALGDVVNVLADMSDGQLPRIGVVSQQKEQDINNAKNYGAGGQLVGNPSYGQWSNRGGTSFWEWYGMYSLFSNLTGGRRVYYNDWDRRRPYSVYQDRMADRYGSPVTRRKWGRNWSSSYQKSGGRDFSRARKKSNFSRSTASARSTTQSRSGRARSSRSSLFGSGSLRRSSTYRRGFRGGK